MAIDRATFAEECARQSLYLGVNTHFLVATAEHRSGISETSPGTGTGPFNVTQQTWDANGNASDLEIVLTSDMIDKWDFQCLFAALTAFRAQKRCLDRLERYPSVLELYQEQWDGDPAPTAAQMDAALAATAALVDPAIQVVTGAPVTGSGVVPQAQDAPTPVPYDPAATPGPTERLFVQKAAQIVERLTDDFGILDFQAAAILGNIGHECGGFHQMQEVLRSGAAGRGGFGWCQWTGTRRTDFEKFCREQGLDPTSDAANYANLKRELEGSEKASIKKLRATTSLPEAVRVFEKAFERANPNYKPYARRDRWATLALAAFRQSLPPGATKLLDPDTKFTVRDQARFGNTTYWLVDEVEEDGGQVLIQVTDGSAPAALKRDTTVFPLSGLGLPPMVETALSRSFLPGGDPHPPIAVPAPASREQAIFLAAARCDETLVTRDVPNTKRGSLACAWAVNEVARRATGRPIGGGLSTTDMGKVLKNHHVPATRAQLTSGMIIISPTQGHNVGHVGIVGQIGNPVSATRIYSNSSSRGVFSHAFTLGKWETYYGSRKKLPVLYYHP